MTPKIVIDHYYKGVSRKFGTPISDYKRVFESFNEEFCISALVRDEGWEVLVNGLDDVCHEQLSYIVKHYLRGYKRISAFLKNNKLHTNFYVLGTCNGSFVVLLDYDLDTPFLVDTQTVVNILGEYFNTEADCFGLSAEENFEYLEILKASNMCKEGLINNRNNAYKLLDTLNTDKATEAINNSEYIYKLLDKIQPAIDEEDTVLSEDSIDTCYDFIDYSLAELSKTLCITEGSIGTCSTLFFDYLFGRTLSWDERMSRYINLVVIASKYYIDIPKTESVNAGLSEMYINVNDEFFKFKDKVGVLLYTSERFRKTLKDFIHASCDEMQEITDFEGNPIEIPENAYVVTLCPHRKNFLDPLKERLKDNTDAPLYARHVNRYLKLNTVKYYLDKCNTWQSAFIAVSRDLYTKLESIKEKGQYKAYDFEYSDFEEAYGRDIKATINIMDRIDFYTTCCGNDMSKIYDYEEKIYDDVLYGIIDEEGVSYDGVINKIHQLIKCREPVNVTISNNLIYACVEYLYIEDYSDIPEVFRRFRDDVCDMEAPGNITNLMYDYMDKLNTKCAVKTIKFDPMSLSSQSISKYDTNLVDLDVVYRSGLSFLINMITEGVTVHDVIDIEILDNKKKAALLQILLRGLLHLNQFVYLYATKLTPYNLFPELLLNTLEENFYVKDLDCCIE